MNNFAIKIYSTSVRYDGFIVIFLFSTDSFGNEKSAYGKNDFTYKIVSWKESNPNIKLAASSFFSCHNWFVKLNLENPVWLVTNSIISLMPSAGEK